jgi:hypothetical protein
MTKVNLEIPVFSFDRELQDSFQFGFVKGYVYAIERMKLFSERNDMDFYEYLKQLDDGKSKIVEKFTEGLISVLV